MSVKVHTEKSGFTRQLPTHLCTVLPEVGLNRLRVREAPGGAPGLQTHQRVLRLTGAQQSENIV